MPAGVPRIAYYSKLRIWMCIIALFLFAIAFSGMIVLILVAQREHVRTLMPSMAINTTLSEMPIRAVFILMTLQVHLFTAVLFKRETMIGIFENLSWFMVFVLFLGCIPVHNHICEEYERKHEFILKEAMMVHMNPNHINDSSEMDDLQSQLECCGVNNYLDYNALGKYKCFTTQYATTCSLPISCFKPTIYDALLKRSNTSNKKGYVVVGIWKYGSKAEVERMIFTEGCKDALRKEYFKYAQDVSFLLFAATLVQIFVLYGELNWRDQLLIAEMFNIVHEHED